MELTTVAKDHKTVEPAAKADVTAAPTVVAAATVSEVCVGCKKKTLPTDRITRLRSEADGTSMVVHNSCAEETRRLESDTEVGPEYYGVIDGLFKQIMDEAPAVNDLQTAMKNIQSGALASYPTTGENLALTLKPLSASEEAKNKRRNAAFTKKTAAAAASSGDEDDDDDDD